MAVYNIPAYDRMFLRDRGTGRKVFIFPAFPGFDPAFTAHIQSNGGRNDLVTVRAPPAPRVLPDADAGRNVIGILAAV